MPCIPFNLNGMTGIMCTTGRRQKRCGWCDRAGSLLCDWKLGNGKTCDKPICATHAEEVAPEKHLCPDHQAAYAVWRAKRSRNGVISVK